jgi:hypothetical protein
MRKFVYRDLSVLTFLARLHPKIGGRGRRLEMRKMAVSIVGAVFAFCGFFCIPAAAQEREQPQLHEEVMVRWWLVPVYAIDKAGAPVLNLSTDDLEVFIKGIKVEQFSLIKKQFQTTQARPPAAEPEIKAPPQKKMTFLVFDAAFTSYNLLSRAKSVADAVIAQSDKTAQYVLLSIEPYAGLKYIAGPTTDPELIAKGMKKFISGKRQDYLLEARDSRRNEIQNAYPEGDERNPNSFRRRGSQLIDLRDKRRVAASYMSALMTLDLALAQFREYSKVVYLYSCGIPSDTLRDFEFSTVGASQTPDSIAYDALTMIGRNLNKSGAILFLVNPSGTRVSEGDSTSGEPSLRILAAESGGRYFEGSEKEVAGQVNSLEGGYYEVSFPDKPEYEGQELSFEIRSNRPGVHIFTVKQVGREKSYADMTELEKEVMALNIVNKGPFFQENRNVSYVAAEVFRQGDSLNCLIPLPPELAQSEWAIFKIAQNFATGAIFIDKESVITPGPSIQVRAKWRGDEFRHDIVLAHPKTGTILVWK